MKKLLFTSLLTISMLSACTTNEDEKVNEQDQTQQNDTQEEQQSNENEHATTESNGEDTVSSVTQAEALKTIKEQLGTELAVVMPNNLPLTKGNFLTATTNGTDTQAEILFLESKEYIPVNDVKLKNASAATPIAKLTVKLFDSVDEANKQIAYEDYSKNGGQQVALGYNINGYQDAGAGSLWTGWNEGRWAIATHTRTDNPDAGVDLAKQAVEYLESHTLPIPHENGMVHLDVYESGNLIVWQDGKLVYTLDSIKDPMKALAIASAFNQ
ncbi:hypothetical protein [Lysinibacillus sp. JNUCC-52]|uniref:hypothetical protein n=1 Tax=Lysinibacillus sp. JNUCC-52 TaxID=2792480 RepID=UPI0019387B64|nr:hypothetical protein JNUCC52_15110 [Lysinibacillus sp. JNUCC-52]